MTTLPFLRTAPPKPAVLPRNVMVIYVVKGKLHIVIAYLDGAIDWRFGDWTVRPESDLDQLIAEAKAEGALISDERKPERPDVPIIIAYRVPLWHALKAVDRLDRAIYATIGRGEGLRRGQR